MKQSIEERIRQRRLQILVHSYIYYELNDNIISDSQWSAWAKELVALQAEHPVEAARVVYAEQFEGFDGSTGAFFSYDSATIARAKQLIKNKSTVSKPRKKNKNKKLF